MRTTKHVKLKSEAGSVGRRTYGTEVLWLKANGSSRLDRIEKQLEISVKVVHGLVNHAEYTDKQIEALRQSQLDTNASVGNLVGAIRDLIDRIPPENLR
jgi:hypothetical protein